MLIWLKTAQGLAANQRLYLNGTRVAQMSDTLPIELNSPSLGIGRHVSGIADSFNGQIDEVRIAHVERIDGWIATTWNNISGIDQSDLLAFRLLPS
jgi:Concanavalin A-like lectin/glucanases superfamily